MPSSLRKWLRTMALMMTVWTWVFFVLDSTNPSTKPEIIQDLFLKQVITSGVPDWAKFLFDGSRYTISILPNADYLVINNKGEPFVLRLDLTRDKITATIYNKDNIYHQEYVGKYVLTLGQTEAILARVPPIK